MTTTLIQNNGEIMRIKGSFSNAKIYMTNKGAIVRVSRTCENGEDVFINGKNVGVILYDGQTKKELIEW